MTGERTASRPERSATYLGMTRSTCPVCLALVNARIEIEDNKMYFRKFCVAHGPSDVLVSEDAAFTLRCRQYARPGSQPFRTSTDRRRGCPEDCGLCPSHQQHTCHPIVEIAETCNLSCPICIAGQRQAGWLPASGFAEIVDNLVAAEGTLENLTLSGGEPTLHPDFWTLVDLSSRAEIQRVSVATNGIRIAEDGEFCARLAAEGVYVLLQWDGFDDDVYTRLRGRRLFDIKQRALARLADAGVAVQLIFVAARGINEHELGRTVELLLANDHILSLVVQPMAMPVHAEDRSFFAEHRITVPGVIRELASQTRGTLRMEDFFPLPCPNPECVALTYLLRLEDGSYTPFPRFVDMERHLGILSQSATLEPDHRLEDSLHEIIAQLWSANGEIPDSDLIVGALKRALTEIFRSGKDDRPRMARAAERQAKSIFIHHYMDPDTFDLGRVMKCCHHYPRPGGRIVPVCAFNHFHRDKEGSAFVAPR